MSKYIMMEDRGYLVISLDFELLWGVFDKVDYREKKAYFENARIVVPSILQLFEEHRIHCTWAIVGMLFNNNWKEWERNKPVLMPNYKNRSLSPYTYAEKIKSTETIKYVFARELIKEIADTPFQEIGTHTYSHYYCMEAGQSLNDFKADLETSIRLAAEMDIEIKSLVFPRNQFNEEYLEVCHNLGITSVRSNPTDWYWKNPQKSNLLKKIFRTGDAYLGANKNSYDTSGLTKDFNKPLAQKASRLLRSFSGNKILDSMKMRRIKNEMTKAAKNNQIYHLWWHPHNFGNNPDKNLKDLELILDHYNKCKEQYGFQSMSMKGINDLVHMNEIN